MPPVMLYENAVVGITLAVDDGVALLTFDQAESAVNTLNSRLGPAIGECLQRISDDPTIVGAVLLSGKPESWIAGADIDELQRVTSADEGAALSRAGHQLLNALARMSKPMVAAIHGAALGGGLEVALACRYRLATTHEKTVLALPEIQLGLIPGAGGTQRLPRLIGLSAALDMILTGRNIRAKKAWQMGLVHELVHPAVLHTVAKQRVQALARGESTPARARSGSWKTQLLDETSVGRSLVFRLARRGVQRKTRGHYPAPFAALDVIAAGYAEGIDAGLAKEAEQFGILAASAVCRQLVSIFFATTALKKDTGLASDQQATPRPVRKLGILGAGFMGAGIASVAVQRGTVVRLKDASLERVAAGWRAVHEVVRARLKKKQLTRFAFDQTMALVGTTTDYRGFANVDLVIEAVFEELSVKHQVLREVEAVAPAAIFASNTSTIPIHEIAAGARDPQRVVGMHFFSPVHKMPLLEVIVTPETSAETTATAVAYGKQLGKTVIVVRDGAGFYVNRMLAPYLNEAGRLIDEGARIEAVDDALTRFGFPVGPMTLLDEVGLDIAGKSGPIMAAAFGDRMAPSVTLQRVIASGRLGRKARSGFYRYDAKGRRKDVDRALYALTPVGTRRRVIPLDEIQQRTVLPMINEAVRCLEEGILRSARDGDIGAIFGIGFPPFLGGPFRYLDTLGAATVVAQLEALNARFPGRFAPAALLREHATHGTRFHP